MPNGFFEQVTDDDLDVSSALLFMVGEKVKVKIIDFKEMEKNSTPMIMIECRVMTGEHTGKLHSLFVSRKNKETFAGFLNAFWTRDKIKLGVDPSKIIGRSMEFIPKPIRDVKGKQYQDVSYIKDLGVETTTSFPIDAKEVQAAAAKAGLTSDVPF
jgi:hypothetical protein